MSLPLRSRTLLGLAAASILAFLSACADGGPTEPSTGPAGEPATAARVVIEPGAVLLTEPGQTLALQAVVYDAAGTEIEADVTWQSNDPSILAVSADGVVTAGAGVGSALLTAVAGGVASTPVVGLAARMAPDVVRVPDEAILRGPDPVDPGADVVPGWEYRVRVAGVAVQAGDLVVGTGGRPLAGRVTAVAPQGNESEWTVALVPLAELFSDLVVDEVIPMVEFDGEIEEVPAELPEARLNAPAEASGDTKFNVGPFECTASGAVPDLDLPSPKLEVSQELALVLGYDNGLTSLVVQGTVRGDFEYKPVIKVEFTGKVDCSATLKTFTVPVAGVLSLVAGVKVPVGLGFVLDGKLEVAQVGFEVEASAQAQAQLGLQCQEGGICTGLNAFEVSDDFDFKLITPDPDEQFKLELSGYGYVFAKPSVGIAFSKKVWEFLDASGGLKQTVDLATAKAQAKDTAYASSFKMLGKLDVEAGKNVKEAVEKLGKWTGQNDLSASIPALNEEETLQESPTGSFTLTPDRVAPGDSTTLGDLATFTVSLDPVEYFGIESVEKVEFLWRKETEDGSDFTLESGRPQCSQVQGGGGKTTFECKTDFLEEHGGTNKFHAFVHAKLFGVPVPVPFEVAANALDSVRVAPEPVCGDPPDWAEASITGASPGEQSDGLNVTGPIVDWLSFSVSARTESKGGWSPSPQIATDVRDYIEIVPLDRDRDEIRDVTLVVRARGSITAEVTNRNLLDARASFLFFSDWLVPGGTFEVDATKDGGHRAVLQIDEEKRWSIDVSSTSDDRWKRFRTYTLGSLRHRGDGNSASLNADIEIEIVDALDRDGNPVAVQICSLSGFDYGPSSGGAPVRLPNGVVVSRPVRQAGARDVP